MEVKAQQFIPMAKIAIADKDLKAAVTYATNSAYSKRLAAMQAVGRAHSEAIRQQAAEAKRRALRQLPMLLERAENNMTANGIQVLWAVNAEEANRLVVDIARRHEAQSVVKSKSMVTEELGINHALEAAGMNVVETDLGEFIAQLAGEKPSHLVAPIIHKTKASIRDLFVEKLDMPPTENTETMVAHARRYLRHIFLEADMGISGGNFIIAETGTLCLVTNEGNGRLVTSLPRVHVALVGIEKIVETVDDYTTLTQMLSRSAVGQTMPVYTHMINGPRRDDETGGPTHVYVILVDNGRSDIYATPYHEALNCIRCGACLNACPVYQAAGGHAYGWVYPGPIGAVLTPLYVGLENATPLPHASSLCGRCKEVCPVDIDLPRLLLDLRRDLVLQGESPPTWNLGLRLWAIAMRSPRLFGISAASARFATRLLPNRPLPGPLGGWTRFRDFPPFAPKSFHQLWRERLANEQTQENPSP
jgi:L-lactate dehydrogenase complex protein LldF